MHLPLFASETSKAVQVIRGALLTYFRSTLTAMLINVEIRPAFPRDGQLERKVSEIQYPMEQYGRDSPPFRLPGLPYNPFIHLSSSSRLVYIRIRFIPVSLKRAFRIRESGGGQRHRWVWRCHPPHPSKPPPSMSPEFRLAAPDSFVSSARRTFDVQLAWDLSAKMSRSSLRSRTDPIWYRHYVNWSVTSFNVVELKGKLPKSLWPD